MANRPFEASHSRGSVCSMLERMGRTLTEKKKKQKTKIKSSYLTFIEFGFRII